MSIFEAKTYRELLQNRLKSMPSRGHGQLAKIAKILSVHPTLLTQIMKGQKQLSLEHGLQISEYLGFNDFETDYFLALIEWERAGHFKLKKRIDQKIEKLRARQQGPQARIPKHNVLSENDRAIFYSNWFYSAIRLLTSTTGPHSVDSIAENLHLERKLVKEVLQFLLRTGLVLQERDGFVMGPQRTYLPADSELVSRHHTNWRLKAIENFHRLKGEEMAFTAPISLSRKDLGAVKKILLAAVEEISKVVDKSDAEALACVNLDLFRISEK